MQAMSNRRATRGRIALVVAATCAASALGALPAAAAKTRPATPAPAAPAAPKITSVAGGDGSLTVTWAAPTKAPNPAITSYTASLVDSSASCSPDNPTVLSCTITGLANFTTVSVTVVATNAVGSSPASAPKSGTPATKPEAPTIGTGTLTGSTLTIPATSNRVVTGATYLWTVNDEAIGKASKTLKPLVLTSVGGDVIYRISLVETYAGISSDPASVTIPVQWGVRRTGRTSVSFPVARSGVTPVDLTGVRLRILDLAGENLRGLDLHGIDLSSADLRGAKLNSTNLSGANLSSANLSGADATNMNASNTDMTYANLDFSLLGGSNLAGAYLGGSSMNYTSISQVDVTGATIDPWYYEHLNGHGLVGSPNGLPRNWAVLRGVLVGPHCSTEGGDLSGLDLRGYDLSHSYLGGTNFAGANLSGANFTDVDFGGSNLQGADLSDAVITYGSARYADFSGATLDRVFFYRVNFEYASMQNASLSGTSITRCGIWWLHLEGTDLSTLTSSNDEGWTPYLPDGWTVSNGAFVLAS